jgi:nicotinamidase-related amidase
MQTKKEQKRLREFADEKGKTITHTGYSVLTPSLRSFLRKSGVDELAICGIYTDVCVQLAAMEAFDAGVKVRVIGDACASPHGNATHERALESLRHILGKKNVNRTSGGK